MKKVLSTMVFGSALLLGGVLFLVSCGGGGGDTPTQLSSVPAFSAGALTRGSAIVNGVRFTAASGSTVVIDDNPGTEAGLRDGMQAKVKGKINSDGTTGEFEKVQTEPEVRGSMTGKGIDDFGVNGQIVVVDDLTKIEDCTAAGACTAATFNDLANTNEVEVHGTRDTAGRIRATRVERHTEDTLDEVKGRVKSAPTGTTFVLANGTSEITVDMAAVTAENFLPSGKSAADLVAGVLVEVHGGPTAFTAGTFTATRIDFEDAEDSEFEAAEGQHFEIEGLVSDFTSTPGAFKVAGMTVQTTSSTQFRGGIEGDLSNNIRVEVEGHKAGVALLVEKVKFKDSIRIEADVTGFTGGDSLTVLGKTVKIMSTTEINGTIAVDAGVKVRGFASGSSITAIRIDAGGNTNANAYVIQGPVNAVSGSGMTIVGLTVNTSAVESGGFKDVNESSVSADAFYSQVKATAPATIVKAKGTFDGATLIAKEVEIEDPN